VRNVSPKTRRITGMTLIAVGVAGLVIPVMPGWLLIGAGASLAKKRQEHSGPPD